MGNSIRLPSPIQKLENPLFKSKGISVYLKRDDLIHPVISGNKWRKLKLNIEKLKQEKYGGLLTFGGAYSNHIAATASAGNLLGIKTIGIIRGDELDENSNQTLINANNDGMELIFVSRSVYKNRYERFYHEELRRNYGNVLVVHEGGANYYGMLGCSEINTEIGFEPDYFITASGTGTTAAGLLFGSERSCVISVPVLKNASFITEEIRKHLQNAGLSGSVLEDYLSRLDLELDYHFGGYGKYDENLINFINNSYNKYQVAFDQIYTGKMFFALIDMINKDKFKEGDKIIALHTGGLQGLSSIKEKIGFTYDSNL